MKSIIFFQYKQLLYIIVETISAHVDLIIRNEKQAHALSKEMFLEQTKINKAKEMSLQDSINVLVSIVSNYFKNFIFLDLHNPNDFRINLCKLK